MTEIFGPIVSMFRKLAGLIKQGVTSVIEAVRYLRDKKNKDKPFSVKVAQVGKIITTGLIAGGAIFLGELFEKILLSVPGMQISLPLLGTLDVYKRQPLLLSPLAFGELMEFQF